MTSPDIDYGKRAGSNAQPAGYDVPATDGLTKTEAMRLASKVSVRGDEEGVLSLQFLVEGEAGEEGGGSSFVDYRFVPLVEEEQDDEEEDGGSTLQGSFESCDE